MNDSLTPEKKRKVALIAAALKKSANPIEDHLRSIHAFETGAMNSSRGLGGYSGDIAKYTPEWPATIRKLRDEFRRVRDRLDQLNTGLVAERLLAKSFGEVAAAADDWARGMSSNDKTEIMRLRESMKAHWTRAGTLGNAGFKALDQGR